VIVSADPTSPTTADILLNPPAGVNPADVEKYIVKLCLQPDGTPCITKECPGIDCPVDGLTPGADYEVSAVAVVNGTTVPASNQLPLEMPTANAITLIDAHDTGPTTGSATAQPPPGVTITLYNFTVTPLSQGDTRPVLTFTSTTPTVSLTGLTPSTQVSPNLPCLVGPNVLAVGLCWAAHFLPLTSAAVRGGCCGHPR